MNTSSSLSLSSSETRNFLSILENRFNTNMQRHIYLLWVNVSNKLTANPQKLWSIYQMELTGGEPDVVSKSNSTDEIEYYDCSIESPLMRRSLCYDNFAVEKRKQNKPEGSALEMANKMNISILTELEYRFLQEFGNFDNKTSSWLKTPDKIRNLGGAIFGDKRYNTVFVYHNGADSYYQSRGFRAMVSL